MAVHFQPEGYHTLTPYIILRDASAAIDFYKKIFHAQEILRIPGPNGSVGHAELKIGDSMIMMGEEMPAMGHKAPQTVGGTPIGLVIYVKNVDAVFNAAVAAGAKVLKPVENQFYGDRMGGIEDPFGHHWYIGTHMEDLSPEELAKRAEKACPSQN